MRDDVFDAHSDVIFAPADPCVEKIDGAATHFQQRAGGGVKHDPAAGLPGKDRGERHRLLVQNRVDLDFGLP
jgi:hypothetical protein